MSARETNIVPDRVPFVGRTVELATLGRLVDDGAPLVTITGSGGTGKTRLARCLAALRAGDFAGGAWFVDLTSARTLIDIAVELARALHIPLLSPPSAADAVEQLGHALAAHGAMLVVLDNFEQVVAEAAASVGRWIELAPETMFVVTSRERLRLRCEVLLPLGPLDVPPEHTPAERVFDFDAVKLFIDRARSAGCPISPANVDAEVLASIVRKLDGVPLAIELSATRAAVLSLPQMRDMLSSRFELLVLGARGTSPRQAALRNTIDWSWELLSPWERDALAQCSVFRGGFDIDAATAILDLTAHGERAEPGALRPIEILQALYDKSLLCASSPEGSSDGRRYYLLESIREYAAEKLLESGADLAAEQRHARHYAAAGARWAREVDQAGGDRALRRLALEAENILHAHARAASPEQALAALLSLEPLFGTRGPLSRFVDLLARALEAAPADAALEARARLALGNARMLAGKLAESKDDLAEAMALAEACGASGTAALAAAKLGLVHVRAGDVELARAALGAAEEAASASGSPIVEAEVANNMGSFLSLIGQNEASLALHERARAQYRELGCERGEALARAGIGGRHVELGQLDLARSHLTAARDVFERYLASRDLAYVLYSLGTIEIERGDHARARTYLGEALSASRCTGVPMREANSLLWLGHIELECRRPHAARELYASAIAAFEPTYARGLAAALAADAAAAAMLGLLDEAQSRFARAEEIVERIGHPTDEQMVALLRCHVDLAIAAEADREGDSGPAEALRQSVRSRLAAATAEGADLSDDTRFAVRALEAAFPAGDALDPAISRDLGGAWIIAADGKHFSAPGRPPVSLERRGALSRLLRALVDKRFRAPGVALSGALLLEAGWPKQKMAFESGLNRVRVAMCTLRKMGLRDLLHTRDDGYLLDPGIAIDVEGG